MLQWSLPPAHGVTQPQRKRTPQRGRCRVAVKASTGKRGTVAATRPSALISSAGEICAQALAADEAEGAPAPLGRGRRRAKPGPTRVRSRPGPPWLARPRRDRRAVPAARLLE